MKNDFIEMSVGAIEKIEEKYNNKNIFSCGFDCLDYLFNNFQNSQVTVLASRPSMGKSVFALNMAVNFAKNDRKILYVSCEMNSDLIMQRIYSQETEIEIDKLLNGMLQADDWEKIANYLNSRNFEKLKENLQIIPSFCEKFDTLSQIVVDFSKKYSNPIIIIDYFQLLNRQGEIQDRYVEFADLAASIKRLAIENDVHIILLSQLSRKIDERTDKTPLISDLSECDALAQHSDNILFIDRDEYWDKFNPEFKNKAKIYVAKVRNLKPIEIDFLFFGNVMKFEYGTKI